MTNPRRGKTLLTLVLALGGLGCGLIIGYVVAGGSWRRPAMQPVIDFLASPLPVPAGATPIFVRVFGGGVGPETISWRDGIALDVSTMDPLLVATIPMTYLSHFDQKFRFGGQSVGYHQDLCKFGPNYFVT